MRLPIYSLRARLLVWMLVATTLIGVLALVDIWREAQSTARLLSDRVLAGAAMAIAERITLDETGGLDVDVPFSALEMLASPADDKVFYRIDAAGGEFLTGYRELMPVETGAGELGFADQKLGMEEIRTASVLRELSTGSKVVSFMVTVAETDLARVALARAILVRGALRLAVLITAIFAIVWVAVTLALRPLDEMGATMGRRAPGDLQPLTAQVPREVLPLVSGMNSFMDRLKLALGALRNFTGNASHQLRTPMATMRAELALAHRASSKDERDGAMERVDRALTRAERVLSQLLVLARVDAAPPIDTGSVVDIATLSRETVSEFIPNAIASGHDLGFEGPVSMMTAVEPVLFQELLRNLIDNALKHTPSGTRVTVRASIADATTRIVVEDDGPGLPVGLAAGLTSGAIMRFARTEGVRVDKGSEQASLGLGLAIISEIADRLGATMTARGRPQFQGTEFVLVLKHADAAAAPDTAPQQRNT